MAANDTYTAIETVFRLERARLIGGLARFVRDIDLAEELAQDALLAALSDWPNHGVPKKPGAWLMATAKRRAIDGFRRNEMLARKHPEIARDMEDTQEDAVETIDAAMDDDLGDELLGLIFAACHPLLSPEARTALTLRLIGGLTTEEIARAFLTSPTTIAQRIVRAKKTLCAANLAYAVPRGTERGERLSSVLEVLYLIFNEGYAATSGPDAIRPALCNEAQRLGRILAGLMPDEPEVHGLLSLMELQASRLLARTAADGSIVPLDQQKRACWDRLLISHGLAALSRAESLGGGDKPYALQAALAACHARARNIEETDWREIAGLYDRLRDVTPSPVIDLNRAVAHGLAFGPETGLALLEPLFQSVHLANFALLPASKGDLLFRSGRFPEAKAAFEDAARLSTNDAERAFLLTRASSCG